MRSLIFLISVFTSVLFLSSTVAKAQKVHFENYTIEDGLALNQVLCSHQDSRGYMWFGTNFAGLSRFDGLEFRTFRTDEGLANNVVFSIEEGSDSLLYFSTNGGLSVYDGVKFKNYTTDNGLNHNRVFTVFEDSDARVWVGTQEGLHELVNGKMILMGPDTILQRVAYFEIEEDAKGNLWLGTRFKGVVVWDKKSTPRRLDKRDGIPDEFVRMIHRNEADQMLIGGQSGLYHIDENYQVHTILDTVAVCDATSSIKGDTWVSTESGIYILKKDTIVNMINRENGLPDDKLWGIYSDREGNIWSGSDQAGALKINYPFNLFSYYDEMYDLQDGVVSVYSDDQNSVWVGGVTNLCRITEDRIVEKIRWKGEEITDVHAIAQQGDTIWIGSTQHKKSRLMYYKLSTQTLHEFTGYNGSRILDITCTNGEVWIGTYVGAHKIKNGKINRIYPQLEDGVWSFYHDSSATWVATEKGVYKFSDGKSLLFDHTNGLVNERIRKLIKGPYGNMWATSNEGLFIIKSDNSVQRISRQDGIRSNYIYSVAFDGDDRIWLGTSEGIGSIELSPLLFGEKLRYRHFSKDEGFSGVECTSNAITVDFKGRIWFGTVKGVTIFNPKNQRINIKQTNTLITDILIHNEHQDWEKRKVKIDSVRNLPTNLKLPFHDNYVTIKYAGISLSNSKSVRYKTRLLPLSSEWNPITSKREANYTNLPANDYTFEVMAKNSDGIWNKVATTFKFRVSPPFYQTWWFYSICIAIVLFIILSYINVRMANKKITKQQIELELKNQALNQSHEEIKEQNVKIEEHRYEVEEKSKEILDSINYAKRIQKAILPPANFMNQYYPDNFVLYLPKDIVAGDFYWMEAVAESNKIFISAADCTGHGVPGAMVSVLCSNALTQATLDHHIEDPGKILDKTVDLLLERFSKAEEDVKDGMDLALVSIDTETNVLQYSGAHNPLWIIRKGSDQIDVIKADKQPVGMFEDRKPFTTHEIQLEKGDTFYIFSDGFADQFGGSKGKKFKYKPFRELLLKHKADRLVIQKTAIHTAFLDWKRDLEQVDDICVIGIRV